MQTLDREQMAAVDGGGFWCGFAVGVTVGAALFVNPYLGGYLVSKAIGACIIEAAV